MKHEKAIQELVDKFGWSEEAVHLGIRARFRCEYCDRDLLSSVDDHDAWQNDHVVPRSKGGREHFENLALCCKACNFMKRNWIPSDESGPVEGREAQIKATRRFLFQKRASKQSELAAIRLLFTQILMDMDKEEKQ